jgi:hypothetical protein
MSLDRNFIIVDYRNNLYVSKEDDTVFFANLRDAAKQFFRLSNEQAPNLWEIHEIRLSPEGLLRPKMGYVIVSEQPELRIHNEFTVYRSLSQAAKQYGSFLELLEQNPPFVSVPIPEIVKIYWEEPDKSRIF